MTNRLIVRVLIAAMVLASSAAWGQGNNPDDGKLLGAWVGAIRLSDSANSTAKGFIYIHVGEERVTVTSTALGLVLKSGELMDMDEGGSSEYRLGQTLLSLAVDEQGMLRGKAVEGEETWMIHCERTQRAQDAVDRRRYVGAARHDAGLELELGLTIARLEDGRWVGSVELPMRQINGLPIADLVVEGNSIRGVLPVSNEITISGLIEDGAITGEFRQGPVALRLDLVRDDERVLEAPKRPQHPIPPFPYTTRELVVNHPAGHTLAGTLTIPDAERFGSGPFATAVLITGGGQENRDSEALGHKPFLVIADYLTRHGVAVFRYDDRGVGASQAGEHTALGKDATSLLLATDAAAVIRRVRDEPEVDGARVGVIGHSEGGLIGPLTTLMEPGVAFVVTLAGPGAPLGDVFRTQFELDCAHQGIDPPVIEAISQMLRAYMEAVVSGRDADDLALQRAGLVAALVDESGLSGAERDALESGMDVILEGFDSPWWRFALGFDPAPVLETIRCPVLALNGTKDRQVLHTQNLDAIESAVRRGGGDVTVIRYEGLNHLFQPADTGASDEYARIETTFDERVLADIIRWMDEKGIR